MSKHFVNSGKKNLPFNMKKPSAEPSSGRSEHLLRLVGVSKIAQDKRRDVKGSQRLITTVIQCREVYEHSE